MPPKIEIRHRVFVALEYFATKNAAETIRRFKKTFPDNYPPSDKTIKTIFEKFMETGSVLDNLKGNAGAKATVVNEENVARVQEYFSKNPNGKNRKCAQQLKISVGSIFNILHKHLEFKSYKIQMVHMLREPDIERRIDFAQQMIERIDDNMIDIEKI